MPKSDYIYIIVDERFKTILNSFTVFDEMISWVNWNNKERSMKNWVTPEDCIFYEFKDGMGTPKRKNITEKIYKILNINIK